VTNGTAVLGVLLPPPPPLWPLVVEVEAFVVVDTGTVVEPDKVVVEDVEVVVVVAF
jgi:hypothetical protein